MDFQVHLCCIHMCHYSTIYLMYLSPFKAEVQHLEQTQVIMCTEFLRIQKQITSLLNLLLYGCHDGIKMWLPITSHFHTLIRVQIKQQIL